MSQLRTPSVYSVACVLLLTATALTQMGRHDDTKPPAGQIILLAAMGEGLQIYTCKKKEGTPGWVFTAPEARLRDSSGSEIGSHGAGPFWQLQDGSSVRGRVIAQSPEPGSVPWLLLEAAEPKGPGALGEVTYIRRSNTHGGVAEPLGCDQSHLGSIERVPYTAAYTFYGALKSKK